MVALNICAMDVFLQRKPNVMQVSYVTLLRRMAHQVGNKGKQLPGGNAIIIINQGLIRKYSWFQANVGQLPFCAVFNAGQNGDVDYQALCNSSAKPEIMM